MWGLREADAPIDCGNSGTGTRLLTGLLAGQEFFTILTGDESIRRRPMGRVVKPLREMGAVIAGRKGGELAPLAITGTRLQRHTFVPTQPGTLTLPELLKKKGLHTAVIGKFFHITEYARPQLMAFDRIEHYSPPADWKGPSAMLKFPPVKRAVRNPAPKNKNSPEYRLWQRQHQFFRWRQTRFPTVW